MHSTGYGFTSTTVSLKSPKYFIATKHCLCVKIVTFSQDSSLPMSSMSPL